MGADSVELEVENYRDVARGWEQSLNYSGWFEWQGLYRDAANVKSMLGMWYSVKAAFAMVAGFSASKNVKFDVVFKLRPDYPWHPIGFSPVQFVVAPTPCTDGSGVKNIKVFLSERWYSLSPRTCEAKPLTQWPDPSMGVGLCDLHTQYVNKRTSRQEMSNETNNTYTDCSTPIFIGCRGYGMTEDLALGSFEAMSRYYSVFDGLKIYIGKNLAENWREWPLQSESAIVLHAYRTKTPFMYFGIKNWYEQDFSITWPGSLGFKNAPAPA